MAEDTVYKSNLYKVVFDSSILTIKGDIDRNAKLVSIEHSGYHIPRKDGISLMYGGYSICESWGYDHDKLDGENGTWVYLIDLSFVNSTMNKNMIYLYLYECVWPILRNDKIDSLIG